MICHLNLKAQRESITCRKFYGDKESYWVGHALTSTPFHFVPGYSGGIGSITKKGQKGPEAVQAISEEDRLSYIRTLEDAQEVVCTLQLLHLLETNGLPLWFNNGLIEYKGANNDKYLHAEGCVGRDGKWFNGPPGYPSEMCVEPPEHEFDILLGDK